MNNEVNKYNIISFNRYSRFNIIFILLTFRWNFDWITFPNHTDVTFQIALWSPSNIIRVSQESPFVEELMICNDICILTRRKKILCNHSIYTLFNNGLSTSSDILCQMVGWSMNKVQERTQKKVVTACCKVLLELSWNLPGGTERTYKNFRFVSFLAGIWNG